jgi:hypothetical protein
MEVWKAVATQLGYQYRYFLYPVFTHNKIVNSYGTATIIVCSYSQ